MDDMSSSDYDNYHLLSSSSSGGSNRDRRVEPATPPPPGDPPIRVTFSGQTLRNEEGERSSSGVAGRRSPFVLAATAAAVIVGSVAAQCVLV